MLIPYEECVRGSELMNNFKTMLTFGNFVLIAHNASFEMEGFKRILDIDIAPQYWVDTMAKAAYYGYPRSLDKMTQALGCTVLKDIQGAAVMRKLCKNKYTPFTAPADFQRLYQYCGNDVETMRQADKLMPDLPPQVQALWVLNAEINNHGVPLDMQAIYHAVSVKEHLKKQADIDMQSLTGGYVQTVGQIERIGDWLRTQGVNLIDLTADTVARTLAGPLPAAAREVLELRQGAGLSSLSKYDTMMRYQVGGRLYQMEDFYGCHTGRATGNGPQLKNLPRTLDADTWANMLHNDPQFLLSVYGRHTAKKIKEATRGMICGSGKDGDPDETWLMGIDLSQIEARATGWLANCPKFLDLFANGRDPYCEYGQNIFGRVITKADLIPRTASKASVLSMGFAGGIGAYQIGAESYNLDMDILVGVILPTATPAEMAEAYRNAKYYFDKRPVKPLTEQQALAADILKQRYRRDFPEIVAYWDTLEQAFLMGNMWAGRIYIEARGDMRVINLPSGRQLFYHGVFTDGKNYGYQGRKGREHLWKGTLIENVAQAINEDCISHYKLLARQYVGPIIHTCYDEFTVEVLRRELEIKRENFKAIMATKPEWTEAQNGYMALPLAYDMWDGKRYG